MKYISIISILFLTACSNNYADKKTLINGGADLLLTNSTIDQILNSPIALRFVKEFQKIGTDIYNQIHV